METLDFANLGSSEVLGASNAYEAPSDFFRPPTPTGRGEWDNIIIKQAPTDEQFWQLRDWDTKEPIMGFSTNLQFEIRGGKNDGKSFYIMLDTRQSKFRPASPIQDYLMSSGYSGRLLTMEDYKNAVQQHVGVAECRLTWTGDKCAICDKRTVKKVTDFTTKADGSLNHVAKCPDCGEDVGAKVKIQMFRVKK